MKIETIAGKYFFGEKRDKFSPTGCTSTFKWSSIYEHSILVLKKVVKRYLGWDTVAPTGVVVMCRALQNNGLHTFVGMPGYSLKDVDAPHFQTTDHNVTMDNLALVVELYA